MTWRIRTESGSPVWYLITITCLIIVVAALRLVQSVVVPLVIAIFLAIIFTPLIRWLVRHRVPTTLAILLVVLISVAGMFGLGFAVGKSAAELGSALPRYQTRIDRITQSTFDWLQGRGLNVKEIGLERAFAPDAVFRYLLSVLSSLASLASKGVVVILLFTFLLFEFSTLDRKLKAILGNAGSGDWLYNEVARQVQRYLGLKTVVGLATGALATMLLRILGVEFAFLCGILTFLLNFIPNIGSIIAAVPPILFALVQFGWGTAAMVAGGYLAINLFMANFVEIRLLGRSLGLSNLVIFLSLIFWGWVWGPAGALLAVPLTMIAKIFLESNPATRSVAILISDSGSVERILAEAREARTEQQKAPEQE